jgi:2-oxoglutarate/2-oxoacid ferredoxin oxidoreductase subunit alpha
MAEIPLVVVNVQRGGPSTGQPTKAEQGDLLTVDLRQPRRCAEGGDGRRGIEDCFYSVITARKIAETFNMVVVVLSDASLATAQQPFPRPRSTRTGWRRRSTRARCRRARSPTTGTPSPACAPLHPGPAERHAHRDRPRARPREPVAYDPEINEEGLRHRSLKLAALQKTLKTPPVFGDPSKATCW